MKAIYKEGDDDKKGMMIRDMMDAHLDGGCVSVGIIDDRLIFIDGLVLFGLIESNGAGE